MSYVEELKSNYQQRRERLYGGRRRPVVVRPAPEPPPPPPVVLPEIMPELPPARPRRGTTTWKRRCFEEITRIQRFVCAEMGVEFGYMLERKQDAGRIHVRSTAIYLCSILTEASASEIGRRFLRDHTTVLNAIQTVRKRRQTDQHYHYLVWRLEQKLKEAQ